MSNNYPAKYAGTCGPFDSSSHIVSLVHPMLKETLTKALNWGLMMSSVRTYLSRIRAAHIHRGFQNDWIWLVLYFVQRTSQVPPHYHDTGQMLKEKLVASPWRQEKRSSGWPPALPPMVPWGWSVNNLLALDNFSFKKLWIFASVRGQFQCIKYFIGSRCTTGNLWSREPISGGSVTDPQGAQGVGNLQIKSLLGAFQECWLRSIFFVSG